MDQDVLESDNTRHDLELELHENLRRAQELLDSIGRSGRSVYPDSYAARHWEEHGHYPSFGCCTEAGAIRRNLTVGSPR